MQGSGAEDGAGTKGARKAITNLTVRTKPQRGEREIGV